MRLPAPSHGSPTPVATPAMRVLDEEQENGLRLVRALTPEQQAKAILFHSTRWEDLPPERTHRSDGRHRAGAFQDNVVLPYEGVRGAELSTNQQALLLQLAETYVDRMPKGHAGLKMAEVKKHIDSTYFIWMGGTDDDSRFYYRVYSPVVLIEFDHHHGVLLSNKQPEKFHTHTILRTPNRND